MTEPRTDLKPGDRYCETCQTPYTPNKPWQKYCLPLCRKLAHKGGPLAGLPVTVGRLSTRKSGCLSLTVLIPHADGERAIKLFGTQGAQARIALEPAGQT